MNLYAFELGRKKELCFAELLSVLGKQNLIERNLDTAVFRLDLKNPQELQDRLGGTIKIVEILDNCTKVQLKPKIQELLERDFKDHSGKIPFAVSTLSFKNPKDINIKELLNFSKKILKSLGLNSRFVNKSFRNTKPSTIYKAKVIQKGIDLNIIYGESVTWLGHSVAIQNIDAYSRRDYEKPARDAKIGMLPPKLAQIMINLAGLGQHAKTIYDPFCGTGTILTEALLMGHTAIGSDILPEMVEASRKNCEWIKPGAKFHIFKKDARFIIKKDLPHPPDAIITEGYLGMPVSKLPSPEDREKTFRELANLHLNWLRAVHPLLPPKGKIVTAVAAFKDGTRIQHLPKFQEIAATAGFKILENFTYDRPDQIVARDIKVLEKSSEPVSSVRKFQPEQHKKLSHHQTKSAHREPHSKRYKRTK